MMPGIGYWLKLLRETTLRLEGTPIPTDVPYQVPLFGGWNQVGNPFARDLPVSEIFVAFGSEQPVDLTTAEQRQWVQRTVWVWDPQRGYQIAETVSQWQGFWVRALRPSGVRLMFGTELGKRGVGRRTAANSQGRVSKGEHSKAKAAHHSPVANRQPSLLWSVHFTVTAPGSPPDTENRLGVFRLSPLVTRHPPLVKPPMVPGSVFAGWESTDGLLAHDFRANRPKQVWTLIVRSDLPDGAPVTLYWDGLTQVPKSVRLSLTDLTTNERFALRNRSSYTFIARKGEARKFILEAIQAPALPLVRITSVQPLRGRGMLVGLILTSPAWVRLEIQTLTGRTVRVIAERFITQLPSVTLFWDGRYQTGNFVPFGTYLLCVIAKDEDGRQQQAVRTVMLR